MESYFPDQVSNPGSLQWKHGVLTTGLPGKSRGIPLSSLSSSPSFKLENGRIKRTKASLDTTQSYTKEIELAKLGATVRVACKLVNSSDETAGPGNS